MADTSFERMSSGAWYIAGSPELKAAQRHARLRLKEINDLGNLDAELAEELLGEILAEGSGIPEVFAPIQIEFGRNTRFGEGCFINVGMTILDICPVTVGDNVLFGPNCELITAEHPVDDVEARVAGWERGRPITIGDDCWFGSRVSVMPGVSIGDRVTIGSGSVVTRDIPSDSVAVGVPAKVVRSIDSSRKIEVDEI